ncbi:hypothetical protein HVTV-2_gp57 [Haloarcula virus HVTV-2]|uniref:Uncharacterized protein n=1 Tax=Haloarcula vallismortis tailed virus 1 TaxID=1262528 RepID=L7TNJ5_9CAUD|nr:hypothetical protein HVTV1_58 [Haloarcula vallismortis tailed virus 1]YP_008059102.1 hypothetical protein M200_gp164 [Halovirus HCTV-5]AGC34427.1 hypothetical protein HVTV1_58 [Haloarcula vallismortis tailed virus 1]AGM11670.1 hypothetical protein HCTV5_61 [Halovirus HCTV-5]UBF22864.1 hypothetical protein HVTV-2_gp57 [Haloarcula virus HVTV-2]
MEQAIANAEADKLRSDKRVESVTVEHGDQGVKLVVVPRDRMARSELNSELHEFATWVEFEAQ